MATPHSLPLPSQRSGTQLPFSPSSPTPNTPTLRTNTVSVRPHSSGATSTSRPSSAVSSRFPPNMSQVGDSALPSSTSLPVFQPRPVHTSTHAGGILPSASFFHPSRPVHLPPSPSSHHTRRSSVSSLVSSEAHTCDVLHLEPLQESHSNGSDESESVGHSSAGDKEPPPTPSTKAPTIKPSSEPLLPTSSRQMLRPVVTTTPYGPQDRLSPTGRVRGSFEKLFKRGFSTDGSKKSPTATSPTSPLGKSLHGHSRSDDHSVIIELNSRPSKPRLFPDTALPESSPGSMSNALTFDPIPPQTHPLPAFTPIIDSQTHKPKRNYQLHPSRNRFFLRGHILTGGDTPWAFFGSLTVVFGITGVWFGTTCAWWWVHESPAVAAVGAYMCLLTISSMFATAFRDPGILPRDLDLDPPYPPPGSTETLVAPYPRDLKVRAGVVRTKYCHTCRTYRPPRSSHCKMCDNCVDGCDHHCQWVNNCVGRRNYTSFFTFLFSAVFTLILVICTSAIHLYLLTRAPFHLDFREALQTPQGSGSAAVFVMSILVIWPVMALLLYHLRLLLLNVTTIEQIRNQAHKSLVPGPAPPNPFSHGSWRRNLLYVLCRPAGFSWIDPAAPATEDKREINPALMRDTEVAWMEEGRGFRKGE
ncbi:hypothetical protein WOLCODRAFT_135887 [Wolfiporia cocos MD-104 SS10]|uniref:Palmitoyltransferase n=1 Tax=Wolfiporia cocos (strain MD-104) TaxID=742152 RepID=A0A2H3J6M5_WOLCO|nr:hypothetical protein WOLCODRAFT_135887 [Wolfiporia cocos MD-104 SS10]